MADAKVSITLTPSEHRAVVQALTRWENDASHRVKLPPRESGMDPTEVRAERARVVLVGQVLERI